MDDKTDANSPQPQGAPTVPGRLLNRIKVATDVSTDAPVQRVAVHTRSAVPAEPELTLEPEDAIQATDTAKAEPDARADEPGAAMSQPNRFKRLLGDYWRHKVWTLPLTVLAVLVLGGGTVLALPTTRYPLLGLFLQRPFQVTVTDSVTGAPVSGATVTLAGLKKETNSGGVVSLSVPVGQTTAKVTKTYYKDASVAVLVDVSSQSNSVKISLVATGRAVPVRVINKITGKPIPEAVITVGASTAKADVDGHATIVVAAKPAVQDVSVTVDGYNTLAAKLQVTTAVVDANTFALTPTGKLYFLSNLSGKLDIVSTNLDGTARKTVLAGTGQEDKDNTLLLAARDWQYLVLLSKRDGGDHAKVFLLSTADDTLTTIDDGSADFSLIGWSGHNFVYQVNRSLSAWLPGSTSLKTYNADTKKLATIVSSNATGSSNADAAYETINQTSFLGSNLIYIKTWYHYPGNTGVPGQQNVLVSVKPDGTGSKTLKTLDAAAYYFSGLNLAKPDQLYFTVYDTSSSNPNYYRLDDNGNITQSSTITSDVVNQSYPTYLLSPSGKSTFWTDLRDGKNTLFVGDYAGANSNQIASLSDYAPYGWFSDDYLLVQKNKSELYILPATGGTPQKISDYFKPFYSIYGYGGGYGGL